MYHNRTFRLLTLCLTAFNKLVIKYCEKLYETPGKNLFWSIKNSGEIKLNFKLEISIPICILMIFLLLKLFHHILKLQINLLILFTEPSRQKAFLTMYVTTETHFLVQKKALNIMHGRVKMYVMR